MIRRFRSYCLRGSDGEAKSIKSAICNSCPDFSYSLVDHPKAICIKKMVLVISEGLIIHQNNIVYLIMILSIFSQAEGKVGYDIHVLVNNETMSTHWGRSHWTSPLSFNSDEKCKGDGNSSKYIKIDGFSGINFRETTHTKKGRLLEQKQVSLVSFLNWIYIDEVVSDKSERYHVKINESTPTSLLYLEDTTYRGDGIFKKQSFTNSADEITTDYNAKKFSKSSVFLGVYRNAIVTADLTPSSLNEFLGENYSTQYKMTSDSDLYSAFRFKSSDELIDENYIGSVKITNSISKVHTFDRSDEEYYVDEWLACCPKGYDYPDVPLQPGLSNLNLSTFGDQNQIIK